MDKIEIFKDILVIKQQLLFADKELLKSIYEGKEGNLEFITKIMLLIDNDLPFILVKPNLIDDILDIITIYRYDEDFKCYSDCINYIIINLNSLKYDSFDNFVSQLSEYLEGDLNSRLSDYLKNNIDSKLSLESVINYFVINDILLYEYLVTGELNEELDDTGILCSMNYFINRCPELFEEEDILYNANLLIDDIIKNDCRFNRKLKSFSNQTKNDLNKILKKDV